MVDNTPKSGKAITYGATVRTVTTVLTRSQARKRTPHELLPGMTIPKVSRVTSVVMGTEKEIRKVASTPKGGRQEHTVGLLSSVDPEWMSTVARAQSGDPFLGPLLRLWEQDRETLTLQERSRLKQFSVLEGLLFYTPQQGGNPVTRLCVPVSDNNAIRLTILYEAHDAYLHHQGIDKTYRRLHAGYYWPTMTGDVQ